MLCTHVRKFENFKLQIFRKLNCDVHIQWHVCMYSYVSRTNLSDQKTSAVELAYCMTEPSRMGSAKGSFGEGARTESIMVLNLCLPNLL